MPMAGYQACSRCLPSPRCTEDPEQKHNPTPSEAWKSTSLFYKWGSETPMRNAISTPLTNQLASRVTERVQNSWGLIVHLPRQPILPVLRTASSMHTELGEGKDRTKDTGGKAARRLPSPPRGRHRKQPSLPFSSQRHFYAGEHRNYPRARDVPAVALMDAGGTSRSSGKYRAGKSCSSAKTLQKQTIAINAAAYKNKRRERTLY